MAMFKSISNGRTGLYQVWHYLLHKNKREVMGQDVFNITRKEDRDVWYKPMDALRAQYGNDKPWNGKPAVTYRHYLISPDPEDKCDLPTLRELTERWVGEMFPDCQAAAVYHNDNSNRVAHAHVIVNNTNLLTGKRLQIGNQMRDVAMPNLVQRLSHELGLSPMPNLHPGKATETRQPVYRSKTERIIKDEREISSRRSRPSWVAQVREQIELIAKEADGALAFDEFRALMQRSGYDVYQTKRGYTYVHPEGYTDRQGNLQHWKVTGKKLGLRYTPYGMARWLGVGAERPLTKELIAAASKREKAAYRRYQQLYLSYIPDIDTQERIEALATMIREGIGGAQSFEAAADRIQREIDEWQQQAAGLEAAIARNGPLFAAACDHEANLPTAKRYNEYLKGRGGDGFAERYLKAHESELAAYEKARIVLENSGVKNPADIACLREQHERLLFRQVEVTRQKTELRDRLDKLSAAESTSKHIAQARAQAKAKISVQYAYKGTVSASERLSVRHRRDDCGRTRYDVIREREIRYQKMIAMGHFAQTTKEPHANHEPQAKAVGQQHPKNKSRER